MTERLESAWRSARHAVELVVTDVATVAPGWVVAGVLLHVLHQVVRTRGSFNIIRAAHPDVRGLRARDVTLAYLAGAGLNGVAPARGGDVGEALPDPPPGRAAPVGRRCSARSCPRRCWRS